MGLSLLIRFIVTGDLQSPDRERKTGFNGEFIGGDSRDGLRTSQWVVRKIKSYFLVSSHNFCENSFRPYII